MKEAKETENTPNTAASERSEALRQADCRHRPHFHFKNLLKTTGQFECAACGTPVRFTKNYYIAAKLWYYIFFAFLIYTALSVQSKTQTEMIMNILRMLAALGVYLLGAYVIQRVAQYETDVRELEKRRTAAPTQEDAARAEDAAARAQELTAEQEELQALYRYYEQLNAESQAGAANAASAVDSEGLVADVGAVAPAPPAKPPCEHSLAPNWRNYVPGMMEFSCAKCGARLSFRPEVKKLLNLIFLVLSFALLYPMMNFEKVSMLQFFLMVLGLLIASSILQYFLIKKAQLVEL